MAFDKPTRNRLASFVGDARSVIADEFTQQFQSLYGISEKGNITPLVQLTHLDDVGLATAALLRERIDYLMRTHPDEKDGTKAAVDRLAREQAFTILNRLAAIRMAEKRGIVVESVGKGYQSKGFKVFEQVSGSGLGDVYHRYRRYIFCLFDEIAVDLGLFDRRSPQGLLFPREPALQEFLFLLNASDLDDLWAEDETIGWIYQYYNDPAERKKMRDESAAPRNSRELAVRNQFFTPRYVVEFLTDNTLGRIWYEMREGQTRLKDQCRYLVRRPTEIFLKPGEGAPESSDQHGLTQEELLKQPVYIAHRPMKDPREIRLLDPACGSMHFGLYAFDLFEIIYEEAWDLGLESLRRDYPDRNVFLREVPRLIIEHNIHGIDIDPRAVQIAGLSLWLRAQKSWQAQCVPAGQRPRILRSIVVCAEPMPGSLELLKEFTATLDPPLLGQLVERVFSQMQLAGEAGSLLKIEEEIGTLVRDAKKLWQSRPQAEQLKMGFEVQSEPTQTQGNIPLDLSGISDNRFWESAEKQIYSALRYYAEKTEVGGYQRRLFADDAARGFAFIDLCSKRYDDVLMNPPFGDYSLASQSFASSQYAQFAAEIYAAFIERATRVCAGRGMIGMITPRSFLYQIDLFNLRKFFTRKPLWIENCIELGLGVMDAATVRAAATTIAVGWHDPRPTTHYQNLSRHEDRARSLSEIISSPQNLTKGCQFSLSDFENLIGIPFLFALTPELVRILQEVPRLDPFLGKMQTGKREGIVRIANGLQSGDDDRWVRLYCEVAPQTISTRWFAYLKPVDFQPYLAEAATLVDWEAHGYRLKESFRADGISPSRYISGEEFYFQSGCWYPDISEIGLGASPISYGAIPSRTGLIVVPRTKTAAEVFSAFLNSRIAIGFLGLWTPDRHHKPTYVGQIPYWLGVKEEKSLSERHQRLKELLAKYRVTEIGPDFSVPWLLRIPKNPNDLKKNAEAVLADDLCAIEKLVEEIDAIIEGALTSTEEALGVIRDAGVRVPVCEWFPNIGVKRGAFVKAACNEVIGYSLGCVFGRWDIRYATGEKTAPELPALFAPLPPSQTGQLRCTQGLSVEPKDVPANYPLTVSCTGILADDENHSEDILARVSKALGVIWPDRLDSFERETCELLGVKTLRDYFHRPACFFADHLKRYSKSRRQAPIYWPLSTAKGNYTLWIYYHRLTDQTLHTALADFVDPKLRSIRAETSSLRESGDHRNKLEELLDFEKELEDFRAEIERIIKLPWKPDLNDGVLITASPLWKLFRLPKWQKDLKACWEKLEKGEYDWAHLAYSIWPDRVKEVCKHDRSIAIAHNLEHLCKIEPSKTKARRGKNKPTEE